MDRCELVNPDGTPVECLRRYEEMLPHQKQQNTLIKQNETIKNQIMSDKNKIKEANNKLIELQAALKKNEKDIDNGLIKKAKLNAAYENEEEQHAAIIATINAVVSGEAIEVDEEVIEAATKKALIEHDCEHDWKTCECALKYLKALNKNKNFKFIIMFNYKNTIPKNF